MARDEVVHMACVVYIPNEHWKERAFFLLFGKHAYIPLVQLLNPKIQYMGDDKGLFSLDTLRDSYALPIHNI